MKSHTPLPVSLGILMCSFAVMFCAPGQGIIVPRDIWYWPEVVKNHEADHEELSTGSEGSEADNELTVKKKKKKRETFIIINMVVISIRSKCFLHCVLAYLVITEAAVHHILPEECTFLLHMVWDSIQGQAIQFLVLFLVLETNHTMI